MTISLVTALTPLTHHRSLLDGTQRIPGVELQVVPMERYLAIFPRMTRGQEFDLCELSVMSYLTAREHGLPFSALPVFPRHRFHHGDFRVNRHAGIATPADLVGRRVGTRSWTVTPGVWDRGILSDEYGVSAADVTWVLADPEHVQACGDRLPPYVVPPDGSALFPRLVSGRLDAGIAGSGRDTDVSDEVVRLFDDPVALDRERHEVTGVLPVFTLVAVHDRVLVDAPWLPQALYDGFVGARRHGTTVDPSVTAVGVDDPSPIGLAANLRAMETLVRLGVEQEMLTAAMTMESLFLPVG